MPDLDRPIGVPAAYADHARLMFDLQCLAYQGDVTRVITFQLARETSNRTLPRDRRPGSPSSLSHHGNDPDKIARMAKINQFHVSLFSEYVQKLKATPDGDGSLLDNTLLLYGSGIETPTFMTTPIFRPWWPVELRRACGAIDIFATTSRHRWPICT